MLQAVSATRGHFRYESGQHSDLWLDLETLWVEARRSRSWAIALAEQVGDCRPDFVCGPLVGGALLAQLVAAEMGVGFVFAERLVAATESVQYRIPESLRAVIAGRRVLLVDDAINAGSAVLATLAELQVCGSQLAGLASLLALGPVARQIARQREVSFFTLARLERGMWAPAECPLCSAGMPLSDRLAGAGSIPILPNQSRPVGA